MSDPLRIAYVVEGATDFWVLDALVTRFLGTADYVSTQIQPPLSEYADQQGRLGGGWRGVLRWCETIGAAPGGLSNSIVLANYDYLVIHVDTDIAMETDLDDLVLSVPCPPAKDTCDNIRSHLITLLGGDLPARVILCVPAQCIEAWVFAALHSDEVARFQPLECRAEVARLLIGKQDRLVRDKDGRARKQTEKYRGAAERIALSWEEATTICPEALRFETECKSAFTSAEPS